MNTPKLYPLRPQEAAIHPERVITRNGKTVRSLKFYNREKSFPLSADIDGYHDWSGRKVDVSYTKHGTFYYETANRQHPLDLFMTTPPEDKPATLTLPELLALTNGHPPHREDGWTRDMLPEGWRPLFDGEPYSYYDQMMRVDFPADSWTQCCGAAEGYLQKCRIRTRRPAPPKPAEEVASKSSDELSLLKETMANIAQEFGISTPLLLMAMAENNEETYADILLRHIRKERESSVARLATAEQEVSRLNTRYTIAQTSADEFQAALHGAFARAESAEAQVEALQRQYQCVYCQTTESQLSALRGELAEVKSRITELEQEYERSTNLAIRETNARNTLTAENRALLSSAEDLKHKNVILKQNLAEARRVASDCLLEKERAREILSATGAVDGGGWKDIETAPKDGTEIMLYWPYWHNTPVIGHWNESQAQWWSECVLSDGPPPTRWQPLPKAPTSKQEGEV